MRASAISVRLGDHSARVAACRHLADQVIDTSWLPGLLLSDFRDIAQALDPGLSARSIWPGVRIYLDGMAETLTLPAADVLADHGCRWWSPKPTGDRRAATNDSSLQAALAELAVAHLSHPTWLVRDAATRIVVHALATDDQSVAGALCRFAQPTASDDTLERAGRCLAAARSHDGYEMPAALHTLETTLASHPSQVLRDLAPRRLRTAYRPLSPLYSLALARPPDTAIDSGSPFLYPFDAHYKVLASGVGLDLDTILAVATRYASESLAMLPAEDAVREALTSSGMRLTYPHQGFAASRAAFGRVVADLRDAGLLDSAPPHVLRLLRTVDIDLIGCTPSDRPTLIAAPPPAGVDKTIARWSTGTSDRLSEYIGASSNTDRVLIGARAEQRILNWDYLTEELVCGTRIGAHDSETDVQWFHRAHAVLLKELSSAVAGQWPDRGGTLVTENEAFQFHQVHADWLAFRPDVALTLGWVADPSRPGSWHTADGDLAVETIWWVDGWWGRGERSFDDTEAQGYAVVLASPGLRDVSAAFGEMTRHFALTRSGESSEAEVEPVRVVRTLPMMSSSA